VARPKVLGSGIQEGQSVWVWCCRQTHLNINIKNIIICIINIVIFIINDIVNIKNIIICIINFLICIIINIANIIINKFEKYIINIEKNNRFI